MAIAERDLTCGGRGVVILSLTKTKPFSEGREEGTSSRDELLKIEERIDGTTYTYEKSPLGVISYNFAELEGKTFLNWLDHTTKRGRVKILEIGGGVEQAAAIQILNNYQNISYTAIEPRPLSEEAKNILNMYPDYQHVKAGVSVLKDKLEGEKFDIIFAHHVAEHLPNPFSFIEEACQLLSSDGIFFCNELPLSLGSVNPFIEFLKKQGASVGFKYTLNEIGSVKRQGIRQISLSVRANGRDILLPLKERVVAQRFGDCRQVNYDYHLDTSLMEHS